MRKMAIGLAAALLFAAAPAFATDWGLGAVGLTGQGTSFSGAGNLGGAFQLGSSTASAQGESFGRAESGFSVSVGNVPGGGGNFAYGNVATGSMSSAATTANGNGFSGAGNIGGAFAGTSLGGVGGFVTAP